MKNSDTENEDHNRKKLKEVADVKQKEEQMEEEKEDDMELLKASLKQRVSSLEHLISSLEVGISTDDNNTSDTSDTSDISDY